MVLILWMAVLRVNRQKRGAYCLLPVMKLMGAACRWLDDKPNQYSPLKQLLIAIQLDLIKTRTAHFMPLLDEEAYTPSNHWGSLIRIMT